MTFILINLPLRYLLVSCLISLLKSCRLTFRITVYAVWVWKFLLFYFIRIFLHILLIRLQNLSYILHNLSYKLVIFFKMKYFIHYAKQFYLFGHKKGSISSLIKEKKNPFLIGLAIERSTRPSPPVYWTC